MKPIDKIWYTRCPVPTASSVAIRRGMLTEAFACVGVQVQSLRHAAEKSVRESHFTHTLENSFRHGGNAPALYARSQGADTVLLGLNLVEQYQGVLALPSSGITSAAELKGRRLALPRRGSDKIDFWRATHLQAYEAILRSHGLTLADVRLVDVDVPHSYLDVFAVVPDDEVDVPRLARQHLAESLALFRDEVDVMLGYSAWGVDLREKFGLVEVATVRSCPRWEDHVNNGYPQTLTVSGGLLRERPDLVRLYLQTLLQAVEWARAHVQEVRRILALELGVAEFWLGEGTEPALAFGLDDRAVAALEIRKQFLLRHRFMQRDFDLQDWIDPRPLQEATAALAQIGPVAAGTR